MSIRALVSSLTLVLIASSVLFFFWWKAPWYVVYGNLIQIGALFLAAVYFTRAASFAATRQIPWQNRSWIAAAAWMWVFGQIWEALAELMLRTSAYGTVADCFWLLGLAMFTRGLAGLIRWRRGFAELRGIPTAAVVVVALGCFLFILIGRNAMERQSDVFNTFVDFAYPGLDMCVLFCSLVLYFSSSSENYLICRRAWLLFTLSFLLGTAIDTGWLFMHEVDSLLYKVQDLAYFANFGVLAISARMLENCLDIARLRA